VKINSISPFTAGAGLVSNLMFVCPDEVVLAGVAALPHAASKTDKATSRLIKINLRIVLSPFSEMIIQRH
jgi:formate-dependent phosphoribosylglycinamide formyltransferase (GAR transformylase)